VARRHPRVVVIIVIVSAMATLAAAQLSIWFHVIVRWFIWTA